MLKKTKFLAVFLISFFISQSGSTQGQADPGPWYFPIAGWSDDGKLFAYGTFGVTQMISNGSSLDIRIQNIVTDKIIYHGGKTWDEGNVGGPEDGYYPTTFEEAYQHVADEVEKKFAEYGIKKQKVQLFRFPMLGEEGGFNVEIRQHEMEPGYSVFAMSNSRGEKRIFSSGEFIISIDDISVQGYVWNPDYSRFAVLMLKMDMNFPYPEQWFVGCHAKAGFKRQ